MTAGWDACRRSSGGEPECPPPELVGRVEEPVRPPECGIGWSRPAAGGGVPERPLELLEPVGELGRAARRRDVGVGAATRREADVVVGDPWQHRQDDPSVGERREAPRLRDPERRRAARPG